MAQEHPEAHVNARWALAAAGFVFSLSCHAQPVEVRVEKQGEQIIVDVEATVAARPAQVWAVLTDYDHMTRFVSALKFSAITKRRGNSLEVSQTGQTSRAFMHFSFSSLRAVELIPEKEIRSHLIEGDFKSYAFTTRIVDQGPTTLIVHHGDYVPNTWVPPGIGPSFIRAETSKQYTELIAEMLKRQSASAPAKLGSTAAAAGHERLHGKVAQAASQPR